MRCTVNTAAIPAPHRGPYAAQRQHRRPVAGREPQSEARRFPERRHSRSSRRTAGERAGLLRADDEQLVHLAVAVRAVRCGAVEQLVARDDDGPGRAGSQVMHGRQRHARVWIAVSLEQVLRARQHFRRAHLRIDWLWVVKQQAPARPVVARLPEHRAVLVQHLLRGLLQPPTVVQRAVLEQLPALAKERRQRAVHGRVAQELAQEWHAQEVVVAAETMAGGDRRVGLVDDRAVERIAQAQLGRLDHVQAIHDELLHGRRRERGGHVRRAGRAGRSYDLPQYLGYSAQCASAWPGRRPGRGAIYYTVP